MDIMVHAQYDLGENGMLEANLWMFAGMAFFLLLAYLVPEQEEDSTDPAEKEASTADTAVIYNTESMENMKITESRENMDSVEKAKITDNMKITESTKSTENTKKAKITENMKITENAKSTENTENAKSTENMKITENAKIIESTESTKITESTESTEKAQQARLEKMGVMTALGISLHNFPEGLVVFNATVVGVCRLPAASFSLPYLFQYLTQCTGRGLAVALAIALHNIPEGIAVALPIYCSTHR